MSMTLVASLGAPSRFRLIAGVSIGNALEYFDLTLYTFFAVTIGKLVFPTEASGTQILLSLGIYGTGYCARPLGGLVIGAFGDRRGRKAAINLTLVLMALGTAMIGLTPSYQQAGLLAPLIVLAGRLLQGFSAGGETGASTTLLAESAPADEGGFFASWQAASQGLAVMFGAAIVWLLNVALPPEVMTNWGWRIPFMCGIGIVPVGLYLRRTVEETLDAATANDTAQHNPVGAVVRLHWSKALWALLALLGANASYVILNLYMPTYGVRELGLSPATTSAAAMVGGAFMLLFAPVGGMLTDRFGRKTFLVLSRVLVIVLTYPAFLLITAAPSAAALLLIVAVMSAVQGLGSGFFIALAENFPKNVRVTGMSSVYALGVMLSGGFGQLIVTWLIEVTGSKLAPALYVIVIGAASLVGILKLNYRTGNEEAPGP
jgi:MFS transporter, MHS family, proline/betaine transporter